MVERKNEGKCETDRDDPSNCGTGVFAYIARLAQVLKNRSCKEVHREKQISSEVSGVLSEFF